MSMFCYQCEQTAKGAGCDTIGVCGKTPETSALQDLLLDVTKKISANAHQARLQNKTDHDIDVFVMEALFTTVTNVNFDEDRIADMIHTAEDMLTKAQTLAGDKALPNSFTAAQTRQALDAQAQVVSIVNRAQTLGDDLTGLQELAMYGLKGMAAYADHAYILGQEDDEIYAFMHEALSYLNEANPTVESLYELAMKVGEVNLKVMGLLDAANTGAYGHPEPTVVPVTPVKGKAILVSGHDLKDLEELLKQTEGKGVNIYTHGEMLPALAYPELKKYDHLIGNYGGAWQDQRKEFDAFPGAILMTTNCIQKPKETYNDRIFTCGLVAWPGVTHIENHDFTPVIEAALAADGFTEAEPEKTITVGFGHNAVLSVAGDVIQAIKDGAIKHFFLIGGCDGAKSGRNYYTDFALATPKDSVILTLACGKYRFNKLDFGDIGGIPRLLDIGQCNDAYSAIQIAVALADAFNCGVNDLPLSMILSWYEQKAVCILLSLLYLGIKDIRLGPTLPAFITPNVLDILVEKFNIQPTTTVEEDLAACLA